jgi:dipeptidase
MCDTFVALPESTAEHVMLFGKNSDRQRNEAQAIEYRPAADHDPGATVGCTYITIPQVRRTWATLLSRPFWIWGAEMGANEHGVVIGNEGLQAHRAASEENALIGMDLVRLALERAASAGEALTVMTTLLEQHGQGGNCGHLLPSFYNNSFMIADATDAFVLETVGREWVAEAVRGARAISNDYSIGAGALRTSAGLDALLREFGWDGQGAPNSAEWLGDPQRAHVGSAFGRRKRATALLQDLDGRLRVRDAMRILRDHDPTGQSGSEWDPQFMLTYSLCIHAGSEDRFSQTTASMVSEIRGRDSVHWMTGTAAPCISIFKPVLMDAPLPAHGMTPTDRFDTRALWWRHECMHRAALMKGFPAFVAEIASERDAQEAEFRTKVAAVLSGGSSDERARVISECWTRAMETEKRWASRLGLPVAREDTPYYQAWTRMNQLAGLMSARS